MTGKGARGGVGVSLAFTFGSAVLWGLAHLRAGRHRTGAFLMALHLTLMAVGITMLLTAGPFLAALAVQPGWLWFFGSLGTSFALATVLVVIRSYQLVRPRPLTGAARRLSAVAVALLCVLLVVPVAYATRLAYVSQKVVNSMFTTSSTPVTADPWGGRDRLGILLVGADSAPGRFGVRTDSMTVASVDTRTGATVLFGVPRNLEHVPLPAGPARDRFPYGFGGEPPGTPGLLNEVWQYAEDHPEMVPGTADGRRGPALLKRTVGDILGIEVVYYAMVDMRGFARIIDAMGGVRVTVRDPIVYGRHNEGLIEAGTRRLSGEEALWYGRSRTYSDDYVRMGRQKCLMNAVAKQADPVTVIRSFERLAEAAASAVSTDVPRELLPDLITLAGKVKTAKIESLQFVPPLISTADPDYRLIRRKVTAALTDEPAGPGTAPRGNMAADSPSAGSPGSPSEQSPSEESPSEQSPSGESPPSGSPSGESPSQESPSEGSSSEGSPSEGSPETDPALSGSPAASPQETVTLDDACA
ncbi:LCP family protein [Planobispora siamensis]|uniref:Cell envelope-related transcriptional attenuator domain-containing protein n=1 Tax=Planobispora siamensis TaxID=936338 RepID=A0A8J3SNZ5_9ACTN|nr:LCP family protein [Planobispora siamensis]GIH93073.1 hypothetical protein Psi01_37030 [Planobispora siamensis]